MIKAHDWQTVALGQRNYTNAKFPISLTCGDIRHQSCII